LPNSLATIVGFLSASAAGTAAPLNPAYRYDEFCFYLEDTAAKLLLCPVEGADEARRAAQQLGVPVFSVTTSAQGIVSIVDAPKAAPVSGPSPDVLNECR
jgi:acyl-CoA synthetase (AMP-forming)/AMP-acid ligase II